MNNDSGFDHAALSHFSKDYGGHAVVWQEGREIFSWGDPDLQMEWASASKPMLSTLLLKAIHEGFVKDPDEVATAEIGEKWPYVFREKDRSITWRHLGNMCSGYGRPEEPGQAYAYNDFGIQLYWKLLTHRLQEPLSRVFRRWFAPLGLDDFLTDHGFAVASCR